MTACIYTYILIGSHLSLKARLPLSLSRSAAKTVFLNQEEVWLFFTRDVLYIATMLFMS